MRSKTHTLAIALGLTILSACLSASAGSSALVADTSKALGGTDLNDGFGHVVLFAVLTAAWYSVVVGCPAVKEGAVCVGGVLCGCRSGRPNFSSVWCRNGDQPVGIFVADLIGVPSLCSLAVVPWPESKGIETAAQRSAATVTGPGGINQRTGISITTAICRSDCGPTLDRV